MSFVSNEQGQRGHSTTFHSQSFVDRSLKKNLSSKELVDLNSRSLFVNRQMSRVPQSANKLLEELSNSDVGGLSDNSPGLSASKTRGF